LKLSPAVQQAIGQRLLLAFKGRDRPSAEIIRALQVYRAGGITLFRSVNLDEPTQVRNLTAALQRLARDLDLPPLLIAADQEGGQLMAVGRGTTQLPGNMAIGATGSVELARRAGKVLGRELSAMGINVDYAPCVDVNINPQNPVVGIRSFGQDPRLVAELAAALIAGLQSQGVAATAKHFPGHGDTAGDSHHGLPSVLHALERLHSVELPPFEAAIRAGVKLVMTAHLALPALDGPDAPPATLSRNILTGLLRARLGFQGLIVTDAMDMRAIGQGDMLGESAVRAFHAGADLLLLTTDAADQRRVYRTLMQAARNGLLDFDEIEISAKRILDLKQWLSRQPAVDLSVIGCSEHQQAANEIAERSITLVRDHSHLIPLSLKADQRVAVIIPRPQDLTPADTSSYVVPELAKALRAYHANVDEFVIPYAPAAIDIRALLLQVQEYDLLITGTLNAFTQPGQQTLIREILKRGIPTIVVALRLPYDLAAFPQAPTYVCTYSILEPSMQALAKALFGHAQFQGRLPVMIPGLPEAGYHMDR